MVFDLRPSKFVATKAFFASAKIGLENLGFLYLKDVVEKISLSKFEIYLLSLAYKIYGRNFLTVEYFRKFRNQIQT